MNTQHQATPISNSFYQQWTNARGLRIQFGSAWPSFVVMGALLLGLGGAPAYGQSSNNCTVGSPGGTFEAPGGFPIAPGPANDTTFSFGIFQIYVNSDFVQPGHDLMDAGTYGSSAFPGSYPGWVPGPVTGYSGAAGTLSSPIIYDVSTQIGRSAPQTRYELPPGCPSCLAVAVGAPGVYADTIDSFTDYNPGYPFGFSAAFTGTREVLTEIQHMTLQFYGNYCANCSVAGAPCYPPSVATPYNMVFAGQHNPDDPNTLPRTIGMVQSLANSSGATGQGLPNYDYPAQSFFNVFADVHLPLVPQTVGGLATVSGQAFPSQGAYFYSDPTQPLTVQNSLVCTLPPSVVYTHTPQTFAVPLYFRYTCPNFIPGTTTPWWYAGDLFGWVSLAGHGTTTSDPCDSGTGGGEKSNGIFQQFVDTVLGTNNSARPAAMIGWPLPTSDFIYPGMTLNSLPGTNSIGLSLDSVHFSQSGLFIYARSLSFSFGAPANPVALPGVNSAVIYTNLNVTGTGEFSVDGTNFSLGSMIGTVQILVSNLNTTVDGANFYSLQALQWNMSGITSFGNVYLEQNPTKSSLGEDIVKPLPRGGVLAASSLDLNLELSTDKLNYFPSNKTLHHTLGNPPCGAAGERLHFQLSGPNVIISWWNPSYTLEGSPSLSPATWTPILGTSPVTVSTTSTNQFYQLSCQ
jgi:hypothetical protein